MFGVLPPGVSIKVALFGSFLCADADCVRGRLQRAKGADQTKVAGFGPLPGLALPGSAGAWRHRLSVPRTMGHEIPGGLVRLGVRGKIRTGRSSHGRSVRMPCAGHMRAST